MERDLVGKTIIVTGANTGIGRVTAETLARRGARVHLACRSEEKTKPVIDAIRAAGGDAAFLRLDLGDLADVRRAADEYLATGEPIHVLINNAGLASTQGHTKDGFELAFGTNHVGHFLFTQRLRPRIEASAPARIVNVASKAHYGAKGIDWGAVTKPTQTTVGLKEYNESKLANVLFTRSLAKRLEAKGVRTYSLHPGVVASDVWRRLGPLAGLAKLFMISNEDGAKTTLYCATSKEAGATTGLYFDKCSSKSPSKYALDDALAEELWKRSEAWVAPFSA